MFSEQNKINMAYLPATWSSGTAGAAETFETDTLSMANYKHATFVWMMGAAVGGVTWDIIPMCGDAVTSGTGAAVPVSTYYYRKQGTIQTTAFAAGSDTPETLTLGTSAGVTTTTENAGALIIFEIDAPYVHDENSTYDCVKLRIGGTTQADAPRGCGCLAILSQPRYPQGVLNSAIS